MAPNHVTLTTMNILVLHNYLLKSFVHQLITCSFNSSAKEAIFFNFHFAIADPTRILDLFILYCIDVTLSEEGLADQTVVNLAFYV